jgi:hypothetical protein
MRGAAVNGFARCIQRWLAPATEGTPYSHPIINDPSNLVICLVSASERSGLTVTFAVNPSRSSIGAGLPAIRSRVISTSIEIYRLGYPPQTRASRPNRVILADRFIEGQRPPLIAE